MRVKSFSRSYILFVSTVFLGLFTFCLPLKAESQTDPQKYKDEKGSAKKVHKIDVKVGEENDPTSPSFQGPDAGTDPFLATDQDPLAEIQALQAHVQKLFDESLSRGLKTSAQDILFPSHPFEPPVNIEDRGESLHITMDIPGMNKEDIRISLTDGGLTVGGQREGVSEERKEEKGRKVYRKERFTGGFKRHISLPVPVKEDSIKAKYKDGVLSIDALKEKASVEKKRIAVE